MFKLNLEVIGHRLSGVRKLLLPVIPTSDPLPKSSDEMDSKDLIDSGSSRCGWRSVAMFLAGRVDWRKEGSSSENLVISDGCAAACKPSSTSGQAVSIATHRQGMFRETLTAVAMLQHFPGFVTLP